MVDEINTNDLVLICGELAIEKAILEHKVDVLNKRIDFLEQQVLNSQEKQIKYEQL